jgi:hypothetical protein
LLRDLKARGLRPPRLVVGDGHVGIWGALSAIFPTAAEQRCWNHYADLQIMPILLGHARREAELALKGAAQSQRPDGQWKLFSPTPDTMTSSLTYSRRHARRELHGLGGRI